MSVRHPADAADVRRALLEQHSVINALLPEVVESHGEQREAAFSRVRYLLAVHESLEEVVLHPHARPEAGAEAVDDRLHEERLTADAVAHLERLDPDSPQFEQAYQVFAQGVVEHGRREEERELSVLREPFSPTDLARVAGALMLTAEVPTTGLPPYHRLLSWAREQFTGNPQTWPPNGIGAHEGTALGNGDQAGTRA